MKQDTAGRNSGTGRLAIAAGGGAVVGALLMYVGLWASGSLSPAAGQRETPASDIAAGGNGNASLQRSPGGSRADGAATERDSESAASRRAPIDLAWLPADAEVFVRWNVAQTWNSPLVQSLADQTGLGELVARFESETGQHPQDIESICAAGRTQRVPGDEDTGLSLLDLSSPDELSALGTVIVVRAGSAIDKRKLTSAGREMETGTHRGQKYFRQSGELADSGSMTDPAAMFFPDDRTLVMGSESAVKKAIERGPEPAKRPELQFIEKGKQLIVAFAPSDRGVFAAAVADAVGDSKVSQELRASIENGLKGLALSADVDGGVQVVLKADCTNAAAAKKFARALDAALAESRAEFDALAANLSDSVAKIGGSLWDGIKTSSESNVAAVSLTVSEDSIADIRELDPQSQGMLALAVMHGVGPFAGVLGGPGLGGDVVSPLEADPPQTFDLPSQAPQEIEVSAIARWNMERSMDFEGNKVPRDLELWIYVLGRQAVQAISWGEAEFEAVTTDAGEALEPKELEQFGLQAQDNYEEIVRSEYGSNHPRHGVRAVIRFPHPRKDLKSLAEVKGSLKLQVAQEKKSTVIQRLPSFVGRQVLNRDLRALGLTLTVKEETREFGDETYKFLLLTVARGNPDVIAEVEPVDANGERLSYVETYQAGYYSQESVSYEISAGDKEIPADLRLKLTLNVGLHEVEVSFALTDIGVPPEPDDHGKPGLPVEGTPAGIKLASKTKWRDGPGYTYDGQPNPPALLVEVNMSGPTAMKALAWGFTTLGGATGEGDLPLQMEQQQYSEEAEATRSLVRILRNDYYDSGHPDDGVRGMLALEHPSRPISTVKDIQGSLKLRVAGETKNVVIKDVKSLVGQQIEHEEFKKAGLLFRLTGIEKTVMRLTLIQGDPNVVGQVTAIDLEGDRLKDVSAIDNRDGQNTFFQIATYEEKFPAGMELKIEVHKEIDILTVPFHFQDLPIPDLPVY